jgi:hypothetical protein
VTTEDLVLRRVLGFCTHSETVVAAINSLQLQHMAFDTEVKLWASRERVGNSVFHSLVAKLLGTDSKNTQRQKRESMLYSKMVNYLHRYYLLGRLWIFNRLERCKL